MKQVFVNKGKIITETVPDRMIEAGCVKVKTKYSCISMGTELSSVAASGKSIIQRVKENPEYIIRGLNMLKEKGIGKTKETIGSTLDKWTTLGYSASGIVSEVASDITNIKVGDRVACAGGGYASHCESMVVPKNLVVKIPDEVSMRDAASVAIGSIAMQGVRRADVKLGEYVCVLGLGLIGQITVQILKAAGVHVVAIDVNDIRVNETRKLNVKHAINSTKVNIENYVNSITDGMGVDSVIITAATNSSLPLKQAFSICRKKGKVVLVGVVDINIDRSDIYEKELEFLISTSYGPGRYDAEYEEKGIDYPYHWVRFTENRNMKEYLDLIGNKSILLEYMYGENVNIDDADKVYESLTKDSNRPLMQVFEYEKQEDNDLKILKLPNVCEKKNTIKMALCGAGGFAKSFILPNISKIEECEIHAIMTRDGSNAKKTALDYGASIVTTSYDDILDDSEIDVVIISMRHNLHYEYIVKALEAQKTVFVEKPLCMNMEQLNSIREVLQQSGKGLMVGYNRRFSPHATAIKKKVKNRVNPIIINYIMNAGYIPYDNWVHTEEGGGRIIGEACHIIDLFKYFIDESPVSVSVNDILPRTDYLSNRDNVVITIKYDKGSVATLTYCANGNTKFQKETCHIFCDNNTYVINDFKETLLYENNFKRLETKSSDKGHFCEFKSFIHACTQGKRFLIPFEDLYETSKISFIVDGMLK